MKIENIFDAWGSKIYISYDELMSLDAETFWQLQLYSRNLLVLKDVSQTILSDHEYFELSKKFGRAWGKEQYNMNIYVSEDNLDPTINDRRSETPVSYFKSNNNQWGAARMGYHADMPLPEHLAYPGRTLYMTNNTTDGSGSTSWLNLEVGWDQCSEEEKNRYSDVEIVMHNMYVKNPRHITLPFLKINPKTGKVSPRLNCCNLPEPFSTKGWIHHINKNGIPLSFWDTRNLIVDLYTILEGKKDTFYRHDWEQGDIIVYDNWFNVHKREAVNDASAGPGGRELRRITFSS